MAEITKTLEEELAELGIVSSYIWKPNRVFAKSGDRYISADVVSDGSAVDVANAVGAEGDAQILEIDTLAAEQKKAIKANEKNYIAVKNSLLQTYQRMYNYFITHGMPALATVMATAIVNLNLM